MKNQKESQVYAVTAEQGISVRTNIYVQCDTEEDAKIEATRMIKAGECIIGSRQSKRDFKILSARILEDGITKRMYLKQLTEEDKEFIKERDRDYVEDAMSEHYAGTGHPFER